MKLVMTLLVRDEEDVLAANLDFHLAHGVDFFLAMDNLSVDGTADILRSYEARGLLRYFHQPEDDYSQHRWVTQMARLACTEYAADWVINNDADEFWYPEQGDLKQVLAEVPAEQIAVTAERSNFLPRPMSNGEFFADIMTVRERVSVNAVGKPLPGKACHRALPDITVGQGNHAVYRHEQPLAAEPAPISILHFPMRSYQQFASKIAKGGAAYRRNTELPKGIGSTWRHLYELWERGELEATYRAAMWDNESIARGCEDGRLIRDERLKIALSRCTRTASG